MILLKIILPLFILVSCVRPIDWRTATRKSSKLAPLPSNEKEAVVQVYGAKTVSWRGYFSIHSWIAIKEKNASEYTSFHVVGWKTQQGLGTIRIEHGVPDRYWFGAKPELIESYVGVKAEKMIPQILMAVKKYPYPDLYRAWPGPNSNTFISYIIRSVPGMYVELPSNAVGKDWINDGQIIGWSETKTGVQFSLYGVLGFTVGLGEGIEINILGMTLGIDLWSPAIKLPFIGRLGMKDKPIFD